MRVYLKVKVKSLAAEAKIIRKEEKNFPGDHPARLGLHRHRVVSLRKESRSSNLAYGFLRGRRYHQLEETCYTEPDWDRVQRLIEKYGVGDKRELVQKFTAWKDAA